MHPTVSVIGKIEKPTWSCVEAARVEELQRKMDVNIAEKHEDVASLPGVGSNIQTPTPGEFLIHWDQSVVGEVLLPVDK